jgi:hypothetical protein
MKTSDVRLPEFVVFAATPVIEAADTENDLPRFTMVAYSGGKMRITGFPHPVVVDLLGLDVPSQAVPIRLDHKRNQGVGHTTRIEADQGQLVAEGLISRETAWARDVARSGTNGFPWQASIGGPVLEAEFVSQGQTVEVNGQTFEGPLHVVRRMADFYSEVAKTLRRDGKGAKVIKTTADLRTFCERSVALRFQGTFAKVPGLAAVIHGPDGALAQLLSLEAQDLDHQRAARAFEAVAWACKEAAQ